MQFALNKIIMEEESGHLNVNLNAVLYTVVNIYLIPGFY